MRLPIGFRAGATRAGIKPSGRPDLALLVSGMPCAWAFVGTLNRAAAPCVLRGRELFALGQPLQAVVVNAGNANCATGEAGFWADRRMAELAAEQLQLAPEAVLTSSTGVIGQPLPVEKVAAGLPRICLGPEAEPFAEAIMTTDLVPKVAEATLSSGARVVGVCKGSGMIAPNMATMLAYLVSDAAVPQEELRRGWRGVVDRTFNQVTVDADTSTNDMAVLMANGAAGPVDLEEFWRAVEGVAVELARKLARDGEGATKLLTVRVTGALSDGEARKAALAVAASPLWKSALYGNDPNWGRIMMALGKSGVAFQMDRVRITLQGIPLYDGRVLDFDRARASQAMRAEEVLVEADLGLGEGQGMAWGCDLTEEYVRINALYTT
ncbi:MAG: bifunctional glutamate N-acetyltransferase/amino-acid acetyltransferase ArgJ [Meiothermus sp.]|uniref:bifunctional glutamate N-acetyltransferase/amino-acid acetyltransferase ArgJ n=1 Tax=Meiothermus sp. TaxID=1955249 RepID=UPI0025F9558A|nr:bifunctional glutamate N-acetyltransferase/amino-acid acetyltransferase ArgJ [Meiothermus sp.]MCS7058632.1 bifunctional glutamate N-acetyltransferase/amino-acid acetyltransferase ArgJ [Meiothermus sp.]MCS7193892.1 bifunctional glutamate N-acetyltransferase/amino-acid acetyltransferase ArgJ [Meiothermus sp.]MCX7739892.1 bifunctional glutamate N-acetyltransferase/amino-acid acetyltransferase ArgJ [Meiothermus sp.]MDW8090162.1 bifunctional glutamate N-acetyltransferase/amino-acid acetyltransfer